MAERTGKEPEIHIGFLRILPPLFSDMTKTIKNTAVIRISGLLPGSGFTGVTCNLGIIFP